MCSTDIFLHIPKTGGTTLGYPLRRNYGYWTTLQVDQDRPDDPPDTYTNLSEEEKRRYRLLKGHCFFGLHEQCPGPVTYFTMLREPSSRLASMHRMMKKEWAEYPIAGTSLLEFVETDHPASRQNMMVSHLTGLTPEEIKGAPRKALSRAKKNLSERIAVAGITERFDESLILMKRRLGWEGMPYYVRSRVGRRTNGEEDDGADAGPDPETRERIRAHNALDVRLYDYAAKQFEEMIRDEGADFRTEVEQFRETNQWVAPLVRVPLQLYRSGRRLLYTLQN